MNEQTFHHRDTRINMLQQELALLRSLVMGVIAKDAEGDYRPAFVKRVLKLLREKPTHEFKNKKTFLEQLEKHD